MVWVLSVVTSGSTDRGRGFALIDKFGFDLSGGRSRFDILNARKSFVWGLVCCSCLGYGWDYNAATLRDEVSFVEAARVWVLTVATPGSTN